MQTRSWVVILLLVAVAGAGASMQGRPDTVSGNIARTYTIVADTELTGDSHLCRPRRQAVLLVLRARSRAAAQRLFHHRARRPGPWVLGTDICVTGDLRDEVIPPRLVPGRFTS